MKRILLVALLLLLLSPLLAWYWLLHTESGAVQAWRIAASRLPELELSGLRGDMSSGLRVAELRYASAAVIVTARDVALDIDVGLMPFAVAVGRLRAAELAIEPLAGDDNVAEAAGPPRFEDIAAALRLPFRLTVERAEISALRIATASPVEVAGLGFALGWDETLAVRELYARIAGFVIDADVQVALDTAAHARVAVSATDGHSHAVATLEGVPTDYRIEGTASREFPGLGATQIQLQGSGDLAGLRAESLGLESDSLRLDGAGEWQWAGMWRYTGEVIVAARDDIPGGTFELTANGDMQQASASIAEGFVLGGRIDGEVEYAWSGDEPWQASLSFADINTARLAPDWPGEVSGELAAHGTRTPLSVAVETLEISGRLRGKPLQAGGGLYHDESTTRAVALEVRHGSALAVLDGALDGRGGLRFELDVPAMQEYRDDVRGNLVANGTLAWQGDVPQLSVAARSDVLQVGDVVLRGVELGSRPQGDMLFAALLRAGSVDINGTTLDDVTLDLDYGEARQAATLAAKYDDISLKLAVDGAFSHWREPWASPWEGTLESFSLQRSDVFSLASTAAAPLEFSAASFAVTDWCAETSADAGLCASVDFTREAGLVVEAELARLPLAVAEAWLPGRLSFTQQVNGRLELVRSAEGVFSGTAGFDVSAGRVATVDDPEIGLDTALGSVAIELADGRLLSAALDLPFGDGGGIDADFALLNAADPRSSAVQGRATIDVPDIRIGVGLLPSLSRLRGQLQSNWVLQGTADAPDLAGDLRLARGEIGYAPIGLLLTDVALDGKLSPAAGMAVSGSFRAGDGLGRIESSAESVDGIDLYIRGERLALVNLPEIRAVVTPDLELAYADQTLRIGGTLAVPSARIQPADLTGGRVSESDDVVIVAGEVPSIRTARDSDSALRYAGSLTVALGDDVVVDLEPARARLGGEVVYSWNGEAMPTGRGRFTLGGNVAAFGQVLDITDGQIRFNGGPASNPSLRIRAEREIYGNSDVKSAGVLIDGPASNPTIEAYTQPASNEERALTLLVTGSDFDYEQGVGALDFGTYIAPRLFVSYGVGIFDRDNVISARYDLARGFGIKMSSGDKASGVDLSYRFER